MLSYQHGYHAGNFADVIKHCTLSRILKYLMQKDKPLFYLETHAGKGIYDLKHKQAEKTGEFKQGIQLIWDNKKSVPTEFHDYLTIIKSLNHEVLNFYPGSPYIALQTLREQDRGYFCELHPAEFDALLKMGRFNKTAHMAKTDGIAMLNSLLPPPEKRGLIFIDPAYEIKEEYKHIPRAIKEAVKRFETGVYCLWYPVVNRRFTEQLARGMKDINAEAINLEFNLTRHPTEGMFGCGLWIINPPYTLEAEINIMLKTLKTYFNPGISSYIVERISKS